MKSISMTNWNAIRDTLDTKGFARVQNVLSPSECETIRNGYNDSTLFRKVISMERYRFGKGEYKYYNYPLPSLIQSLRENFYPPLASIANEWFQKLSLPDKFPAHHRSFLDHCQQHNQKLPTPLVLRYEAGGFNTLHQDLYGSVFFPFQMVVTLSQHGEDYDGGELVFTQQVPRAQSKAEVVIPDQGDAVIFTTNFKPVSGQRGYYKSTMKHGVSEVKSGQRHALGIIFHDAT